VHALDGLRPFPSLLGKVETEAADAMGIALSDHNIEASRF
jgi:hypothetical protein